MKNYIFILSVLLLMSLTFLSQAGEKEEPAPDHVSIGVYVTQIYNISLKENQFSVDFYVWFRWKDKEIKPYETFEVVNGHTESKEVVFQDVQDGLQYVVVKVKADIIKFWAITNFPLDNHILTLEIEDSEVEDFKLRYVPDKLNSTYDKNIKLPGWKFDKVWASEASYTYHTNYGDSKLSSEEGSDYSRFVYSMQVVRTGWGYFLKLFLSIFITTFVAFVTFFIRPTDLDPRFGLGVGAFFASIANQYIISSALPDSDILTLADKLIIWSVFCIFASIAESTLALKICNSGKEEKARVLDRISLVLFPLGYIIGNAIFISRAL